MHASLYAPVIDALERGPSLILPLVREVPDTLLKRRPKPGKWSAHEHACHLAAVQPMFMERLDLMLSQDHPTIRPYVPENEQAEGALLEVDLQEALRRLERERASLVARLRQLKAADWDRTAEHPEYSRYSLFILFRHAAMHDMLHAYRIEECLLNREWASWTAGPLGSPDFNDILGEFQEFGPRRTIPVEDRWRQRFPGASAEELRAWAARCKLIEAEAWNLAEGVIAGRLREKAAKAELGRKFPGLDADRIGRTMAQALYFASK